MKAPRIMLAAGRSGSGKTMITCGLLRALQQMGKQPAAFKCGPDYIDPMFHEQVIGAPSCNLDPFFTCLLYTSPSPRDLSTSRMPSSA